MLFIKESDKGIVFKVFVQPRSSKNMVSGIHDDALKIKLTAPPVDGAANKMCGKFLAKLLKVPKSSIEIISGETARNKKVLINIKKSGNGFSKEIGRIKEILLN